MEPFAIKPRTKQRLNLAVLWINANLKITQNRVLNEPKNMRKKTSWKIAKAKNLFSSKQFAPRRIKKLRMRIKTQQLNLDATSTDDDVSSVE